MKALYLTQHADHIDHLFLPVTERPKPSRRDGHCLVQVLASGLNPSDALGALGYFKHAKLPRIPGRDFSGIVVEGEKSWLGKSVWGSGGAAGLDFDGTHAEYLTLPTNALSEIPNNLNIITAGAQPLPYLTAYYSLVSRARIQKGETVLVIGALGQVGRAAMSICQWKHCHPIAVVRGKADVEKAKALGWDVVDSETPHLTDEIREKNAGEPIQVILNSLGNLLWPNCMEVLAEWGRLVTISAREGAREIAVNLFDLYRANQELIGINTVGLGFTQNATLLNEMKSGFESGALLPLAVENSTTFSLNEASNAYTAVMNGTEGKRIVIQLSK